MMYDLSDAAIVLAGGYGTLDELFEIITWNQLSIHDKKIVLLNSGDYYNNLVAHLNTMQSEDFLYDDWKKNITIIEHPQALVSLMGEDTHQSRRG